MEVQNQEKIIVIDFGGQYNQLVARRVRENNVYCEIYSYRTPLEKIREMAPKGIILTGGPASCYEEGAAACDPALFSLGIPVLGLCYGAQLMQWLLGGNVSRAANREYGRTEIQVDAPDSPLLKGVPARTIVWMSHFDYISRMAPDFTVAAHSLNCPVAVCENRQKNLYAIQFHPEVLHTEEGFRNYFSTWYIFWANDAAKEVLGTKMQGTGPDLSPGFLMNEVFSLCGWEGPAYQQYTSEVAARIPVVHASGRCMAEGVLTDDPPEPEKALLREYQNVQYYYLKHFAYGKE